MKNLTSLPEHFFHSLAAAFMLGVLDLTIKKLAVLTLVYQKPVVILPFLNFTLTYNEGIAFSILAEHAYNFLIIVVLNILIMSFMIYLLYHEKSRLMIVAITFILGGAFSNLIDRLIDGSVVDFISLHLGQKYYFAIFNGADIFINIGAGLLVVDFLYSRAKNKKQ